jgi:DNA-binding transcriptional regulator YiaG
MVGAKRKGLGPLRPVEETFGGAVRSAREALGETKSDLGRAVGVRGSTVMNWEHDVSLPNGPNMSALMSYLTGAHPDLPEHSRRQLDRAVLFLENVYRYDAG